jgi:hypothetical protein
MMLAAGFLALAMLAADPAPSLVQWPWEAATPVRHHRRYRHHRRRHHPQEAVDCKPINDAVKALDGENLERALASYTQRQRDLIRRCSDQRERMK